MASRFLSQRVFLARRVGALALLPALVVALALTGCEPEPGSLPDLEERRESLAEMDQELRNIEKEIQEINRANEIAMEALEIYLGELKERLESVEDRLARYDKLKRDHFGEATGESRALFDFERAQPLSQRDLTVIIVLSVFIVLLALLYIQNKVRRVRDYNEAVDERQRLGELDLAVADGASGDEAVKPVEPDSEPTPDDVRPKEPETSDADDIADAEAERSELDEAREPADSEDDDKPDASNKPS